MYYRLLDLLCCPYDGSFPLKLNSHDEAESPAGPAVAGIRCESHCGYEGGLRALAAEACKGCLTVEIREGTLICPSCDRQYPIRDGVPRLLPEELAVGRDEAPVDEAGRVKWLQQRQRNRQAELFESDFVPYSTEVDRRQVIRILDPKPHDLILDAGAGTGRLTRCITPHSREIVALDFATRCLDVMEKNLEPHRQEAVVHRVVGDVEHKPFRDNLFDKVLSFGILEHLPNQVIRRNCLREVDRVMKPGALAMFTSYSCTPIRQVIATILRIDYGQDGWHDEIFFHRALLEEMRELVNSQFSENEISGIRNFPRYLGEKLKPLSTAIDIGISATSLSLYSGYYFLIKAIASDGHSSQ